MKDDGVGLRQDVLGLLVDLEVVRNVDKVIRDRHLLHAVARIVIAFLALYRCVIIVIIVNELSAQYFLSLLIQRDLWVISIIKGR